jgi:hypothetical protein
MRDLFDLMPKAQRTMAKTSRKDPHITTVVARKPKPKIFGIIRL